MVKIPKVHPSAFEASAHLSSSVKKICKCANNCSMCSFFLFSIACFLYYALF